jgi:hypothetical protein
LPLLLGGKITFCFTINSIPMRHFFTRLLVQNAVLLLLLIAALPSMGQVVTDPSNTLGYDQAKLLQVAAFSNSRSAAEPKRTKHKASSLQAAAATNCFIPRDNSYTAIPRNDDGSFGPIALPFTFNLYGSSYTQVWINTNGNLTFTGPYNEYNAAGFPFSLPMVAPFWADVDTRNVNSGAIYYKLSATNLIVTWDNVGYFSNQVDKVNTFQTIIGSSTDALLGPGQNVSFRYDDMQWTTGSASGGINGFGGTPATVGVNQGNGTDFVQVGRFNLDNSSYDGPGGSNDGINYLDGQCYGFNVTNVGNIPPSVSNLPPSNTVTVAQGQTVTINPQFLAPEVNQTVTVAVNTGGLCNTTATTTSGATAGATITVTGAPCNVGTNSIVLTATDNGSPVETTTVTLTVIVTPASACNLQLATTVTNAGCGALGAINLAVANGTAPYTYSWTGPNGFTANTEDISGLAAGTYSVTVTDAAQCSATTTASVTSTGTDTTPPTILAAGFITAIESDGTRTIEAADVDWGSTDACSGIASMTISPRTFTCANVGPNLVTLTVTDNAGNSASETVTVFIVDNSAPVIMAAGFQTTLVNGTRTIQAIDIDYGSYDNCGSIASMIIDRSTFTCANVGPNQVTLTVTDNAGNVSTRTVTVLVTGDATCTPSARSSATNGSSAVAAQITQLEVYPNPATERTTLAFQAKQAGAAQILVYNSLGRLVATVYDGPVQAKQHYSFSLESQKLPAGVYSCQLRTAGHTQLTRLMVVK